MVLGNTYENINSQHLDNALRLVYFFKKLNLLIECDLVQCP